MTTALELLEELNADGTYSYIHTDGYNPFENINFKVNTETLSKLILFVGLYDYPYGDYNAYILYGSRLKEINLSKESFDYCDDKTSGFTPKGLGESEELKEFTAIIVCNNGVFTKIK